jgi:hypothetical protein
MVGQMARQNILIGLPFIFHQPVKIWRCTLLIYSSVNESGCAFVFSRLEEHQRQNDYPNGQKNLHGFDTIWSCNFLERFHDVYPFAKLR